jgi:hypothetical protein
VASAQSLIQGENLMFSPPQDFKMGFQSQRGSYSITEFVPRSETVDDWTHMLTVQIYPRATIDPASFLQDVGKRYVDSCPGTTAKGLYTGKINGYVVSMLLLRCPNNPATRKPETTAFRVIKGKDALYSVQRAWRAIPSDLEVDEVMQTLAKVTVCDPQAPEHPCPSLDSLVPLK